MRKAEVDLYAKYTAKVSGKLVTVRLTSEHARGGWYAINEQTGRPVRIKSAARLRERVS